jgi:hypothetical protein
MHTPSIADRKDPALDPCDHGSQRSSLLYVNGVSPDCAVDSMYLRKRGGCTPLHQLLVKQPLDNESEDSQRTNHQMAAFSVPLRLGWTLLTIKSVAIRTVEQTPANVPRRTGTDHSFAR